MQIRQLFKFSGALVALATASLLASCGGGGGGGYGGGGGGGSPAISVNVAFVAFGAYPVGTMSATQSIRVSNNGNATLTVSSITITGANPASFSQTNNCTSVVASSACTINVSFTPAAADTELATLSVMSNGTGGTPTVALSGTGQATGANTVAVLIDQGPAALPANSKSFNELFVTVTICAPGTQTCQAIDHVQVDTGSSGLRIISSVLNSTLAAALNTVNTSIGAGHYLVECAQFADGWSWGPVKAVDLTVGMETAANFRVQIVGDPAYPGSGAPANCVNGPSKNPENDVVSYHANGLIGVGFFLQDCGPFCPADQTAYSDCSAGSCAGYPASVTEQLQNPVSKFQAGNNNGVAIQLPSVGPAADLVNGVMVFGVPTASANLPAGVTVFQIDATGRLSAGYDGATLPQSVIDSGSNGWYFPNNAPTIQMCPSPDDTLYCPANGAVALSATIHDAGDATHNATIDFTIYDLSQLMTTSAAGGGLGGTPGTLTNAFDFGLPFFFTRPVYVGFEGSGAMLGGKTTPAVAF